MNERQPRPRRSFIFTPGLRPELFTKAVVSGADMVCVELEDGIAPKDKELAREKALAIFKTPQPNDGVERIVRINSVRERFGIDDIQAILNCDTPPPALMLPKVRTPDEIVIVDQLLSERGHKCRLHVIIETNAGLEAAYEIANSSERIEALFFGGIDMVAELRCVNSWDNLLYARSRVVHAAASAGLDVVDVPFLDLENLDGLRIAAQQAKDLGFSGKGSIHPKQIQTINEIFTPSSEEISKAKKLINAFEKADTGLVVLEGKLIEKPVMREMYRILSIAKKIGV